MSTPMTKAASVDEYIRRFPPATQTLLKQIRKTIRAAAPGAEEIISYGIAGYKQQGMLIFFAGFANHVSVYPAPRSAPSFKKELDHYKGGKGTVQFPLNEPLPLDLIKRIVKYRLAENEEKMLAKKKKPVAKKKTAPKKAKKKL
ncbi:MAG TPA: DUF1801 domain-containing protein [Chitinophagaceae bacterium]|jgi:uncharacterized protein YdhG (YjbR/CyaY superfamily)|nr:DUF1801 domain-containing protein [Chitinophagaceae bacterium]